MQRMWKQMADVKWIKLYTNMFDNRKIKQIEMLPDGDALLVIWLKLLTLAGNVNDSGFVYFTKDIPYTDQMLSVEFNKPLSKIQLALTVFQQYHMIDITDDILKISNWEKYQNIDRLTELREYNRIKQQEHRAKKKLLTVNDKSMTSQSSQDTDIDKDIDIELDLNKELNKDIDSNKNIESIGAKTKRFCKPTLEEVKNYINENNLNVNPQYWYDFYESNGWKVGRNPMKDWKACVRRWNKTEMNDLKSNRNKSEDEPQLKITAFDV